MKVLRDSADKGDAKAQRALAERYALGDGVPKDLAEAARWLRKAAEVGDAEAQLAFGLMTRDGLGVPQDYQEARRWIQKSADAGSGSAQYLMGLMYQEGDGVARDLVRAHMWLNLASSNLTEDSRDAAARKRDWLESVLTPRELDDAHRLTREWSAEHAAR